MDDAKPPEDSQDCGVAQQAAPAREPVVIVDSLGVFFSIVWAVMLPIVAIWFLDAGVWPVSAFLFLVAAGCVWIAVVKAKGTVIDFATGRIRYPGGGVAASTFLGNLSPKHWVQMGRRFENPIADITQLAYKKKWTAVSRWKVIIADSDKKDQMAAERKHKHVAQFSGQHGTASVSFRSEAKCDEVLGHLRSVLPKGTPVIDSRMGFEDDST
jgi:hypothetical protein